MPQGRTNVNSFGDKSYDGKYIPSTNMLINGLGQLSDGITGSEDISVIDGHQPWIGWSNETNRYITIIFQFDFIRQINRITIHTNNLFSKDILIFKTAIISFSTDDIGRNYSNAIIYQHNRDDIFEIPRPVLIELNNHIAKFVRLDLYFDSKWLLISEITFDSQIYNEKYENKNNDVSLPINSQVTTFSDSMKMVTDIRKRNRDVLQTTPSLQTTTKSSSSTHFSNFITTELSLAFFIGASLAIGLLLIVSLVWLVRRKKKLQFQK
jgi:discoidin domain receptor family protein 2